MLKNYIMQVRRPKGVLSERNRDTFLNSEAI